MDANTRNRTQDRPATQPRLAMRTLSLALALAAVPAFGTAIGAGLDPRPAEAPAPAYVAPAPQPMPADVVAAPALLQPEAAEPEAAEPTFVDAAPLVDEPSPLATLEPGEFLWNPEVAPSGPVVVVVSLPEQRAHVYRNGLRIGVSTISSGKPGHETPTGTFPILQKRVEHYSNLYDNAPMPYMQRLTWDGVALHAGRIPGHPASHGCIRLPREFAELLYDVTRHGTTVVVADESSHSANVTSPGARSPVDPYSGLEPSRVDVAAMATLGSAY